MISKFLVVEVCNQESINALVKEIGDANTFNKLQRNLNTNPNHNYEILLKYLLSAKLKCMYVEWKTTPITHINYEMAKQRFKGCEKIVQKEIEEAKRIYFN